MYNTVQYDGWPVFFFGADADADADAGDKIMIMKWWERWELHDLATPGVKMLLAKELHKVPCTYLRVPRLGLIGLGIKIKILTYVSIIKVSQVSLA